MESKAQLASFLQKHTITEVLNPLFKFNPVIIYTILGIKGPLQGLDFEMPRVCHELY